MGILPIPIDIGKVGIFHLKISMTCSISIILLGTTMFVFTQPQRRVHTSSAMSIFSKLNVVKIAFGRKISTEKVEKVHTRKGYGCV